MTSLNDETSSQTSLNELDFTNDDINTDTVTEKNESNYIDSNKEVIIKYPKQPVIVPLVKDCVSKKDCSNNIDNPSISANLQKLSIQVKNELTEENTANISIAYKTPPDEMSQLDSSLDDSTYTNADSRCMTQHEQDELQLDKSQNVSDEEAQSSQNINTSQEIEFPNVKSDKCKEDISLSEAKATENPVKYVNTDEVTSGKESTDKNHKEYDGEIFNVSTYCEMRNVLDKYMADTSMNFVVFSRTKSFGKPIGDLDLLSYRIQWSDKSDTLKHFMFDGIPQVTIGHYILQCQFGTDKYHVKKLNKQQQDRLLPDDDKKRRNSHGITKKIGCPATIYINHVIRFPQFKITKDTNRNRTEASHRLKYFIKNYPETLECTPYIVGKLPDTKYHQYHSLNAEENAQYRCREAIHVPLVSFIQDLYLNNISRVDIRTAVNDYVENRLFYKQQLPDQARRKYYPTRKDINNVITRLRRISQISIKDMAKIEERISKIKVQSNEILLEFVYNKGTEAEDVNPAEKKMVPSREIESKELAHFSFIYQNSSQQQLLVKYGNVLRLVEIPYISEERSLHYKMFALIVQTNIDYQVVCCIAVSKCKKNGLIKALHEFREWNNLISLNHFIIDYSEEIIVAASEVFPDAKCFFNPVSCEEKWDEFLNIASNELLEHREEILQLLKNIMYSSTEETLTLAASVLESNGVWKRSQKLRSWFNDNWLVDSVKWVKAYRPEDLLIFEHFNELYETCMTGYVSALALSVKIQGSANYQGLPKMIEKVHEFATSQHKSYVKRINEVVVNRCNPDYRNKGLLYHSIPFHILPFIKDNIKSKYVNFETHQLNPGLFQLKAGEEVFSLSFGDATSYPFCLCTYWQSFKIPCVHMVHVFSTVPGFTYEALSSLYRYNSLMLLDHSVVNISKTFITTEIIESRSKSTQFKVYTNERSTSTTEEKVESEVKFFLKDDVLKDLYDNLETQNMWQNVTCLIFQLEKLSNIFEESSYKKILSELKSFSYNAHRRIYKEGGNKHTINSSSPFRIKHPTSTDKGFRATLRNTSIIPPEELYKHIPPEEIHKQSKHKAIQTPEVLPKHKVTSIIPPEELHKQSKHKAIQTPKVLPKHKVVSKATKILLPKATTGNIDIQSPSELSTQKTAIPKPAELHRHKIITPRHNAIILQERLRSQQNFFVDQDNTKASELSLLVDIDSLIPVIRVKESKNYINNRRKAKTKATKIVRKTENKMQINHPNKLNVCKISSDASELLIRSSNKLKRTSSQTLDSSSSKLVKLQQKTSDSSSLITNDAPQVLSSLVSSDQRPISPSLLTNSKATTTEFNTENTNTRTINTEVNTENTNSRANNTEFITEINTTRVNKSNSIYNSIDLTKSSSDITGNDSEINFLIEP